MSTPQGAGSGGSARAGLVYVIGLAGCGFALSALYVGTGIGVPCPFRLATGWECPLCGTTRMGAALLQGDVAVALAHNPVTLVATFVLAALGVLLSIEVAGGPPVRPPTALWRAVRRVRPAQWLVLVLMAAVVDVLLRHLL